MHNMTTSIADNANTFGGVLLISQLIISLIILIIVMRPSKQNDRTKYYNDFWNDIEERNKIRDGR